MINISIFKCADPETSLLIFSRLPVQQKINLTVPNGRTNQYNLIMKCIKLDPINHIFMTNTVYWILASV